MKYTLYGDGIHDDTLAIQEMLDTMCEVNLPAPEKNYLISKTLIIDSNKKLTLPRFAVIKLADNSNCPMVMNKVTQSGLDSKLVACLPTHNEYEMKETYS